MISSSSFWQRAQQRWNLIWTTLQEWPWRETWHTLRQRFREDRLGLTAGSLTFTTTIAVVPLFTVMLALFTAFPVFSRFRKVLEKQVLTGLVPEAIAKPVLVSLNTFAGKASQLGGMGLVALGVTAMALMLTIDHTLNGIWRVRRVRPLTQRVLVYWAALTLGPLLVGASLSLTSYVVSASKGLVGGMSGGLSLVLGFIVFALQTAGYAALYRYVPNTFVKWEHAWGGAIFTAVGLELAQRILALYLTKVPVYTTIYGAFAAVPIFLVWIYVSWLIVLFGAVVVAYTPSLLSRVKRWPDTPGSRFALGLAVLRALALHQHGERRGLSASALAHALRADPVQIEPVLGTLQGFDWIGQLAEADEHEGGRYVLLCDPACTTVAPLVREFLLRPDDLTGGFWQAARLEDVTLAQALSTR